MVHYKLIYFPVRGVGESIRQIFALAGQDFEDVRLSHEQFKPVKPSQIAAYAEVQCKLYLGLAGKSPLEEAIVDSLADQYADYRFEIKPWWRAAIGESEGDVEQLKIDVVLPARDKFLGFITKFLKENKSGL
ncbi:unnamed protein product [Strongylus vulgaris]|uniref:glutathione transferase n=1 Tax=Strongylus vulgaris TaxID=40348 RepID=A0A3P7JMB6_STRVU|nr:unnamed protein product [Strongylus vulgaris]